MRSVINFKNSNLTWHIVLRHFQNYHKLQNLTIQSFNADNQRTCFPVNDNLLPTVKISEENVSMLPNIEWKNKFDNNLYNRYCSQIDMINVMNIDIDYTTDSSFLLKNNNLEITVFTCMKKFCTELKDLFPDRNISSDKSPLTVICFNHHTVERMSNWNSAVYKERSMIANIFVDSSKEICQSLSRCGFWADFIDPFSGTPHFGQHTNDTLFETDPRMRSLGFQIKDLGCCKVLSHCEWQENVFCGLIFSNVPSNHPILSLLLTDK